MKAFTLLADLDGVLAAGEFSRQGEGYHYSGLLEPEQARMAAIMCRSNSESMRMQTDLFDSYAPGDSDDSGGFTLTTPRGWVVTSEHFTVCVVGYLFCFIDNASGSLNHVLDEMSRHTPAPRS